MTLRVLAKTLVIEIPYIPYIPYYSCSGAQLCIHSYVFTTVKTGLRCINFTFPD